MITSDHITTSAGLISTAFIENIRELGTRQRIRRLDTGGRDGQPHFRLRLHGMEWRRVRE